MNLTETAGEIAGRYLANFREAEMDLVCDCLLKGRSLAFIGAAGTGKSNVVDFLRAGGLFLGGYLDPNTTPAYFPVVDGNKWQRDSLWEGMLMGLQEMTGNLEAPKEEGILGIRREVASFWQLKAWLAKIRGEHNTRVMFILDDFDKVLQTGPLTLLDGLNSLRSEGNRERLCYLVLLKRMPQVLGRRIDLEQSSKFFDLFRENMYALEPYLAGDAMQMLQHMNEVAGRPLRRADLPPIYQLAGGHAHLLRATFDICSKQGPERSAEGEVVARLAAHPDVQATCRRILGGLHTEEQEAALALAQNRSTSPTLEPAINLLMRRGLLLNTNPPDWFSPLFGRFLATETQKE